ncbi:MAG: choline dehydrogenase-like flavoprotein [Gammaproteobacteria bacterium]|jgi:choline dehydrogenase-like flavoprotein
MLENEWSPDVVIIGSGVGGATFARTIAPSNASILILERGEHLSTPDGVLDPDDIHRDGKYMAPETWYDNSKPFSPWIYYCVGGNTKFFGAVTPRYREMDFEETEHAGGVSPAWPFSYAELEPYYCQAESLFRVHGRNDADPCDPWRSKPYPHAQVPDEPTISNVRDRLEKIGTKTHPTPLCADETWLDYAPITWDAYPNTGDKKADAENALLQDALAYENVRLVSNAKVVRLNTGANGKDIISLDVTHRDEQITLTPKWVILSAGAVNSAALLLKSANNQNPQGISNSSGMVGGNYMSHHCTFMMAVDPHEINDAVYQKTVSINEFYLGGGDRDLPLGHVQMCGKITPSMIQGMYRWLPKYPLRWLCSHSVDWFLVTEDLPIPENRLTVDSMDRINFNLQRPNYSSHVQLAQKMKDKFKQAGYRWVLSKPFGINYPTHQCGTIRMGNNSATSPIDQFCRSYDHPNLLVVDASMLPTSAAVNPALTIIAQSLRAGAKWLSESQ